MVSVGDEMDESNKIESRNGEWTSSPEGVQLLDGGSLARHQSMRKTFQNALVTWNIEPSAAHDKVHVFEKR